MAKIKTIKSYVSEDIHEKFTNKCEKVFGNKRSATLVIRKLAIKFINGEIKL